MSKPFNPEEAENLEDMEKQFAVKGQSHIDHILNQCSGKKTILIFYLTLAVEHLMTYWSILEKVKGSQLRLTKQDNEIYESFMEAFPDFDPAATLSEDEMKSKAGKEKWRTWMMKWEKVEDFNFGTIIRTRADAEYDQDTTIFGVRMQFYAIEIARNRAGLNDWIYEKAQKASS
ncbi:hypothetical protein N7461_005527 [Penicillium sp. DV-2018c]|nr:hypothetical protein N7461_005527 [Penicillium sp. DV-2018c]